MSGDGWWGKKEVVTLEKHGQAINCILPTGRGKNVEVYSVILIHRKIHQHIADIKTLEMLKYTKIDLYLTTSGVKMLTDISQHPI